MKKLFFWFAVIGGIIMLIGSCSSTDETATATTTSESTSTAAGSLTVGSYTMSGVYTTACTTSGVAAIVTGGALPSDSKSYREGFVVTGNDNFTTEVYTYSDTGCTTSSYIFKTVFDNVTVGTVSGANYPVTANEQSYKYTANTTIAETYLETALSASSSDITVGTEKDVSGNGNLQYDLWTPTATTIYLSGKNSSSTPSTAGTILYTKE